MSVWDKNNGKLHQGVAFVARAEHLIGAYSGAGVVELTNNHTQFTYTDFDTILEAELETNRPHAMAGSGQITIIHGSMAAAILVAKDG